MASPWCRCPPDLATVEVLGADGETVDERAPMGEVDFGD